MLLVAVLDRKVVLEQCDHGQIARRSSERDRRGLENQPAKQPMRMGEFIQQTRFADAGFADNGHQLTRPRGHRLLRAAELIQFGLAADELRQAPDAGGLQTGARGARANELMDLLRFGEALDRHRTERPRADVSFRQPDRPRRHQDRAGLRHLLHAGRQMRGLADDGVFHIEIFADGADHDLT